MRALLDSFQGQWLLLHYSTESNPSALSRSLYADRILLKFGDRNLKALEVVAFGNRPYAEALNKAKVRHPIVVDREAVVARDYGFAPAQDQVLLIDPGGHVTFSRPARFLRDGDLRQLIEKALQGSVSHPAPASSGLTVGDRFPGCPLQPIHGDQDFDPAQFDRYVFFTAECTACSFDSYFARLEAHESRLLSGRRQVAAVFSSRFPHSEIVRRALLRGKARIPLFRAEDEMPGLENAYYLQALLSPMMVIDTQSDGVVASVKSLEQFLIDSPVKQRSVQ